MNEQHRELRAELAAMSPQNAVAFVLSFELPQDEAECLIEHEVRRRSYVQICEKLHLSPEAVKRARRRAFVKIANGKNERETR